MYGLKRAAAEWNGIFSDHVEKEIRFKRPASNSGVYIRGSGDVLVIILLYVDDLIFIGPNLDVVKKAQDKIGARFKTMDLGELNHLLGIKFTRNWEKKTLELDQKAFIEQAMERYEMKDLRERLTPTLNSERSKEPSEEASAWEEEQLKKIPYREAVGTLLYLARWTRPDIAAAVGICGRRVANYRMKDWNAVRRIFQYLKATKDTTLKLDGTGGLDIRGYSDADWAGDLVDRKSTSGYCFFMGKSLISWSSKKQQSTALSTAESEIIALSEAAKEAVWLRKMVELVLGNYPGPLLIYEDNQAAISFADNQVQHNKMKHIDIRDHFIQEQVAEGIIKLEYCRSENMIADIFTKGLGPIVFGRLAPRLGLTFGRTVMASGSVGHQATKDSQWLKRGPIGTRIGMTVHSGRVESPR